MNLARLAIERDRVSLVAFAIVIVAGLSSYFGMSRAEDPGFTVRTALVLTRYPGASPARVERLVTDKLEKRIQQIPELEVVRSESKTGTSVVYVDIQDAYDEMRPIWDDLRRKVESARSELPEGVIGPFVNDEFGDVFGVVIGIVGDGFSYRELRDVADEVRDELLLFDRIAKVDVYGAQEERVFVEYNNARLAEVGLSPLQLQSILEARNIIISGGQVSTEYERITLEPTGNFESVEDLRRTVITLPASGDLVYLEDVVDIQRGYKDPPESRVRVSGEPALVLAVSMSVGENVLLLGEEVRAFLRSALERYPIGIEFEVVQFQPDAVRRKVRDFVSNLGQAVAVVAGVMLVTLGLRTGLIVASLIPMAMLAGFLVMGLLGTGLDQMSLAALIIALGMLVDTAIVMSESIMVTMEAGKSAKQAACDAADELTVPLLTSALTTAAAFLPFYLAESKAGEYTGVIFVVVTITLLSSWLLGLTLIPYLCVKFLRVRAREGRDPFESPAYRAYRGALLAALRRPALFLLAVAAIFAAAMLAFRFVPRIFFPPNDRPTFTAELALPVGSPIERTEAVVEEVEDFLRAELLAGPERPTGVTSWAAFIGNGGPRFVLPYSPSPAAPDFAYLILNATSRDEVDRLIPRLERFCHERFPDLKATVRPLENGPPTWPPIEVRISGRDVNVLSEIVDGVKRELAEIPGTKLVDDDWGAKAKKILVEIDQPRALRAGVSSQDVAISLQTFLTGLDTTEYREGDDLIPVTLRSIAADRDDLGKIESINVYAQSSGNSVPLKQVASVRVAWEPSKIKRRDRRRTITVEAGFEEGFTSDDINGQLAPRLREQETRWPPGYDWEFGGELETSGESQASIFAKLPVSGLVIVLLLVSQFNSLRRPLIILVTIPLGVAGVIFGLLVADSYFGFMTLLGIVSLAGIVINNAIVLIDRISLEIDAMGREPADAIVSAAQQRLRPILLTTATTVLGLIPLWLGGGAMFEPMAIAIIFGLAFATLLTLGLVPVLYALLFRVDFRGGAGGRCATPER